MNKQEIERAIEEKENQQVFISRELLSLKKLLLPLKTGLNEGDLVVNKKGEKGIICFNGNETYWWGIRKLKKDGIPSNAIQNAYSDWTKV